MRAKTTLSVSSCKQNIMVYYFMLDYMVQLSSITLGYANIMLTNCCMSFFQTDAEFRLTPPFDQKEKRLFEITSPCAGWMTDRVIKETEKRKKKMLPGETVWSLIERLLEVRPDVRDMPEIV